MSKLQLDNLPKNLDPSKAADYKEKMLEYMEHLSFSKGKPGKAVNPYVENLDTSVGGSGHDEEDADDNEMASATDEAAIEEAQRALMSRSQAGSGKEQF